MGAWGTGIFQDDTACDIRDEYRDLLGEGLNAQAAKEKILESYAGSFADTDESSVAWLALAAVQSKTGRLDESTRNRALAVIDSGADLVRWKDNPKDFSKRKTALEKLRLQLTAPQPAQRKIRKHVLCECPWRSGDLFTLRLNSDRLLIFRVIDLKTDRGGTYPVCEILNWLGNDIPPQDELKVLNTMRSREDYKHKINKVMLVGFSKKWSRRVQSLGVNLKPFHKVNWISIPGTRAQFERTPTSVVHFKILDSFLKEWFLVE